MAQSHPLALLLVRYPSTVCAERWLNARGRFQRPVRQLSAIPVFPAFMLRQREHCFVNAVNDAARAGLA